MQRTRWAVFGGVALVGALIAGLGTVASGSRDEPVRVYLVHRAEQPERGQSFTSFADGITVFSAARGADWPVQVLGYLEDVDEHWVVVRKVREDDRNRKIQIPRERVQLIEEISEEQLESLLRPR